MITSEVTRPSAVTVVPVLDGERPVGAWVVGPETAVFRPVIDLTRLAGVALAGAAVVAVVAATRSRPAVGAVTMGPGGWISIKGAARPPLRSASPRPWWARLIGAHPLAPGAGISGRPGRRPRRQTGTRTHGARRGVSARRRPACKG